MPNMENINRHNINKSPLGSLVILGVKGSVWVWPTAQTWHYWLLQRAALDGPVRLKGRDSDAPGGCSPRPSPPLLGWLRRHQLWNGSIQRDGHPSPKRKWLEEKTKGLLLSHKYVLHEWSCSASHATGQGAKIMLGDLGNAKVKNSTVYLSWNLPFFLWDSKTPMSTFGGQWGRSKLKSSSY